MNEMFDVWQWFPDGSHERVGQRLGPKEAVELAHSYTVRPAAKIGIIQRVTIVDSDDYTCFEWKYGEGVTFA
jgi:hypothetical protein